MARTSSAREHKASKNQTPSSSKKPSSSTSNASKGAKKVTPKLSGKLPTTDLWEFDSVKSYRYTVKPGEVFNPKKHVEFLTAWAGTDAKGTPWKPTWEPLENFDEQPENLNDFLNKEKFLKAHLKL